MQARGRSEVSADQKISAGQFMPSALDQAIANRVTHQTGDIVDV
jgi:hypothetical protein